MEHRCGARQAVNLSAELWHKGKNCGSFCTRDISHDGLFLLASPPQVREGDYIKLRLDLHQGDDDIDRNIVEVGAMVLHRSEDGIGLMWAQGSIELYRLLNKAYF